MPSRVGERLARVVAAVGSAHRRRVEPALLVDGAVEDVAVAQVLEGLPAIPGLVPGALLNKESRHSDTNEYCSCTELYGFFLGCIEADLQLNTHFAERLYEIYRLHQVLHRSRLENFAKLIIFWPTICPKCIKLC